MPISSYVLVKLAYLSTCETIPIYNALASMIAPRYESPALLPLLQRFSGAPQLAKHAISFLQPRRVHCEEAGVIADSLLTKQLHLLV